MPLLERGYKAAAATELERSIRDLEERDKEAQTKPDSVFMEDASKLKNNLDFARQLNLISREQAAVYRERVKKAILEFEHIQRTETRDDMVDSFENPRERAARYQSMDSYTAQILRERAKANVDRQENEQEQAVGHEEEELIR